MRIGFVIFGLLLASIGLFVQASVWDECRADGHSVFYCIALTSR